MVGGAGWVFFDLGLVDAAVALEYATGSSARNVLASYDRYHRSVFPTPPWPEIYVTDKQREHNLPEVISDWRQFASVTARYDEESSR